MTNSSGVEYFKITKEVYAGINSLRVLDLPHTMLFFLIYINNTSEHDKSVNAFN